MIKLKKLACTILAFALSAITLTGCHGKKDIYNFYIPDKFDESQKIEINFWAKNDTNVTQAEIYKKAIADFEELYPNVTVKLRLYTDYSKIYNDVITNISTNTTPNVCITYPDHIATYLTGEDVVVPLDGLMHDEKYGLGGSELKFDAPAIDEMVDAYLDECKIDDTTYALPFMRSTEALYINKTYVEKLGYKLPDEITWDFIWEVSDAAAKKDASGIYPVNNQKVMIPFIYKSTDNFMIQYLHQMNAGYSSDDGEILLFNDTTRDFIKQIADHTTKGAFSTFKISSYPANFLNAGQSIFAIDSTAGSTWMGSDAPLIDIAEDSLVDFEIEVREIPQVDPKNPQMISQGPSICIFNKEDQMEVLASYMFAEFLLTNDVQTAYSETEGYVPVTKKAQESEEYLDYLSKAGADGTEHYFVKIAATKLLLDNIDNTFITPVFNGSASVRDAAGSLIENAAKSARRKKVVDDAYIDSLYSDTVSLYHLDQINLEKKAEEGLGKLPKTSVALIAVLALAWFFIILSVVIEFIKKKYGKNND